MSSSPPLQTHRCARAAAAVNIILRRRIAPSPHDTLPRNDALPQHARQHRARLVRRVEARDDVREVRLRLRRVRVDVAPEGRVGAAQRVIARLLPLLLLLLLRVCGGGGDGGVRERCGGVVIEAQPLRHGGTPRVRRRWRQRRQPVAQAPELSEALRQVLGRGGGGGVSGGAAAAEPLLQRVLARTVVASRGLAAEGALYEDAADAAVGGGGEAVEQD
ncbi:hypothetical protein JKP88DRAFT_306410 [Tribonema minus]|uniref:Uncharacterized protein n=1 Tax=Tribonema minus TaxID=303371 RepID=A0A835ZCN2_9STRA|nr:hypothetical protein JKP88DRAFT_306410 [Tribonema minus]